MSDESFSDYIARERDQLRTGLEIAREDMRDLEDRCKEIERELEAMDAYEAAKSGKAAKAKSSASAGSAPRRARAGSRREAILAALTSGSAGMSRGELIKSFGIAGDKSGEMSVSNALTALSKNGQVVRMNGRYYLPEQLAYGGHAAQTDQSVENAAHPVDPVTSGAQPVSTNTFFRAAQ
jgi:hypothetical protein